MAHNGRAPPASLRLATERHYAWLGSAKVNFRYLDVGTETGLNPKALLNLRRTYRANNVDQYRHENHLDVLISPEYLQSVLEQHNLTLRKFREQGPDEYCELNFPDRRLRCLQGKHRIAAARRFLPPSKRWWIIDFYSKDVSDEFRTAQAEHSCNETRATPGEIYVKFRWYQANGDVLGAAKWLARMSPSAEKRISSLDNRPTVRSAFDSLLAIPAIVSSGALLSVWHKYLSLYCDDELIHYLSRIHDLWRELAQNCPDKMRRITCKDVEALEGLAPGVCETDETKMRKLVLDGGLFQAFPAADREHICDTLTHYKGRILSLRLFFQDVIFFAIGAYLVRKLLSQEDYWDIEHGATRSQRTVRSALAHNFHARIDGDIPVQLSEDRFYHANGDSETQFDLAYRQLWLCAWRSSRCIPWGGNNNLPTLQREPNPQAQYQLASLARKLGFASQNIADLISHNTDRETSLNNHPEEYKISRLKRQGVPYAITFKEDRKFLFLDKLHVTLEKRRELDSLFVLRDIYISFFGDSPDLTSRTSASTAATDPNAVPSFTPVSEPEARQQSEHTRTFHSMPDSQSEARAVSPNHGTHSRSSAERSQSPRVPATNEVPFELPPDDVPSWETPAATEHVQTENPSVNIPPDFEGTERRLQELLENLTRMEGQWEKLDCTLQKQETDIASLRGPATETRHAVHDILAQIRSDIQNEAAHRRQVLDYLKSQTHFYRSEMEQNLRVLGEAIRPANSQSGGNPTASAVLQSAQAVAAAFTNASSNINMALKEAETLIPLSWRGIEQFQIMAMALQLDSIHGRLILWQERIGTLASAVSDLESLLYINHSQDLKSSAAQLQDVYDDLQSALHSSIRQRDSVSDVDPSKCPSTTQWLETCSTLEITINDVLSTASKTTTSIDRKLIATSNTELKSQLDEIQNHVDIEEGIINNLAVRNRGLQESFANTFEQLRAYLATHMDKDKRGALEHQWNNLTIPVDLHEDLSAINTAITGSKHNIEGLKQRVTSRLDSAECCERLRLTNRLRHSMQDLNKRRLDLEQQIMGDEEVMGGIISSMVQEVHRLLSTWSGQVAKESSRASQQKQIATHTDQLDTARQAAEAAGQAADVSDRLLGFMVGGQQLINDAPGDLQTKINGMIHEAETALEETKIAARSAVESAECLELRKLVDLVKSGPKEAATLCKSYQEKDKGHHAAEAFVIQMGNLTTKIMHATGEVQTKLQVGSQADSSPDTVQAKSQMTREAGIACAKTTDTTLAFYYKLTKSMVEDLKGMVSSIQKRLALPASPFDNREASQLLDESCVLESLAEGSKEILEMCIRVKSAALEIKSVAGECGSRNLFSTRGTRTMDKILELANFAHKMNEETNLMVQQRQVSWWKELADQEREKATIECGGARKVLMQVIGEVDLAQDSHETLADAESLLSSASEQLNGCSGPAENFRSLAHEFMEISRKAKSVTNSVQEAPHMRGYEGVKSLDEVSGVLEAQEPWDRHIRELTQKLQALEAHEAECQEFIGNSEIDSGKIQSVSEGVAELLIGAHTILEEMQSHEEPKTLGCQGTLKTALETASTATGVTTRILWSTVEVISQLSKSLKMEIEQECDLAKLAADCNEKKEWSGHRNTARTTLESLQSNLLLGMNILNSLKRIKASVNRLSLENQLSKESRVIFADTVSRAETLKICENEAKSIFRSIGDYWWRSRATQDLNRAKKAIKEANEKFHSLSLRKGSQKEHHSATVTHYLAEDAYNEAQKEWLNCVGPEEEYRKMGEKFTIVYNKAVAAIKAADTIRERQAAAAILEGHDRLGDSVSRKRRCESLEPRRSQRHQHRSIRVYRMTDDVWEGERHIIPPTKAPQKARDLREIGDLWVLNSDLSRLGQVSPDDFASLIAQGQSLFFLDIGCPLTSFEVLKRAQKFALKVNDL